LIIDGVSKENVVKPFDEVIFRLTIEERGFIIGAILSMRIYLKF
jgi:hypothetical protein